MKIYFCDLCNESVPQADLDAGRAFLRKGRVTCARCDQLMHKEAAEGASGPFGGGAPPEAPGTSPPTLAASGAGAAAVAATPTGSTSAGGAHERSRRRGGGGATFLAVLALVVACGGIYWLWERGSVRADALASTDRMLDGRLAALGDELRRTRTSLEEQAQQQLQVAEGARAEVQATLGEGRAAMEARSLALEQRVAGFEERLVALQRSIGSIERHDQELLGLQQKFTELGSELQDLGFALADLADEHEARAGQAASVVDAPVDPSTQPAWVGLVAQLSSPEDGDRWTAVIALGETRDPAVAPYLIPVLKDEDLFVRMAAARMLGDLGAPQAVGGLIDALSDPEPSVREAVYIALKEITKRDLPFDALSEDAEERAKRIAAWREWWEKEKQRLGG